MLSVRTTRSPALSLTSRVRSADLALRRETGARTGMLRPECYRGERQLEHVRERRAGVIPASRLEVKVQVTIKFPMSLTTIRYMPFNGARRKLVDSLTENRRCFRDTRVLSSAHCRLCWFAIVCGSFGTRDRGVGSLPPVLRV